MQALRRDRRQAQTKEISMKARSTFLAPRPARTIGAAAAAAVVALGTLFGVVTLFQSRGVPLAQLAAAERACTRYVDPTERHACTNAWVAVTQTAIPSECGRRA